MAAPPRKRTKAPPPTPRWQRWLEHRTVQVTLLVTAFGLVSFFFGTTRDLFMTGWRHYTGAELAHQLAPEVQELRSLAVQTSDLAAKTVERIDKNEQRVFRAEQTLDDIAELKKIEQERTGAVFEAQKAACLAGELSVDACNRYGHRHRDAK